MDNTYQVQGQIINFILIIIVIILKDGQSFILG